MQREVITFNPDHPLPPDVQRIISAMFNVMSKTTITVGADVRRLIIGVDIFGFLWRMLLNPCRREAIINTIYSDSLENFMIYISRWHAAEFNIYAQTLPFNRRYSAFSYPEMTHDWRALSRWAGWLHLISPGLIKGVFFVCKQYFISRMITGTIRHDGLCKFMHAVLKSETMTRSIQYVKNSKDFYDFMIREPIIQCYMQKMGVTCYVDLLRTALGEEIETVMNLLKTVK